LKKSEIDELERKRDELLAHTQTQQKSLQEMQQQLDEREQVLHDLLGALDIRKREKEEAELALVACRSQLEVSRTCIIQINTMTHTHTTHHLP